MWFKKAYMIVLTVAYFLFLLRINNAHDILDDDVADAIHSLSQQQRGSGVHRKSQEKRSSSCHYFASCEKSASHVQTAQLHEGWY